MEPLDLGEDLDTDDELVILSREEEEFFLSEFSSFLELKYLPNVKGLAKGLEGTPLPNPKRKIVQLTYLSLNWGRL